VKHPLELANVDRRRLQDDGAVILDDKIDAIARVEVSRSRIALGNVSCLAGNRGARHRSLLTNGHFLTSW
jgi:hypothetical protein